MAAIPARDVVILTGSSGLIGSALARRLADRYTIVGLDRESRPHPPVVAECVCMDITSDESLDLAFQRLRYAYGDKIASVIHLAAYYDFSGEPSEKYEEVTVQGTRRLLRGLQAFEVGQFIFSSSMLVHRPTVPGSPINEDSPVEPRWPYPESKVKAEQVIREERGQIPAVILRIAGVYDDRCHSLPLAHQIQRIFERELTSYVFPGELSHGQAFMHMADLLEAFDAAVERRERAPSELALLVGEPETLSYDEIQREIGRLVHGEEWHTREIPESVAKAGARLQDAIPFGDEPFIKPRMIDFADDHYELDITRAREVLGWEPTRGLRETLPKMIEALEADPARWYRENKLEPPDRLRDRARQTATD